MSSSSSPNLKDSCHSLFPAKNTRRPYKGQTSMTSIERSPAVTSKYAIFSLNFSLGLDLKLDLKIILKKLSKILIKYVFQDPNSQCHFLIDYESGLSEDETILEPFYSKFSKQWQEEMSFDFLDASRSHKFFRAFYVPWTRDQYCHFGKYLLLRNKMI